jgi:uncharacterized protein (TIGR00297 family)
MTSGEWLRKSAHVAAFAPALLLPWLTPGWALLIAGFFLLQNVFLLPRLAPRLYRPDVRGHGALEIILYPAAVAACLLAYGLDPGSGAAGQDFFPPDARAGAPSASPWYLAPMFAWFALGILDACIGIGCRLLRAGPILPWNDRKPALGAAAGTAAALAAGAALLATLEACGLAPSGPAGADAVREAGLAAREGLAWLALVLVLAALLETTWFGITDNLAVPFLACVLLPLAPNPILPGGGLSHVTWPAVAVPLLFGAAAYAGRMLTSGGSLLGAGMAFLLMAAEPRLFVFLGGFFALGMAATRFRFQGKASRNLAEGRDGRRGAAQVFGAMGTAAWMTPLVHLAEGARGPAWLGAAAEAGAGMGRGALLVCVAPLAAKAMDTVSSEMGKAMGGRTVSLRNLRAVEPGTEGAVSLAGTLWGFLAAALLAAPTLLFGWASPRDALLLVGIALAANVFESYWGEWAAPRGLDDGPHTNFLMTLVAALLAWLVFLA